MEADLAFAELIADFAELIEQENIHTTSEGAAPGGLSILQLRILSELYYREDPPSMRQLASTVNISMPSASVIFDKLEAGGYLTRKNNPADRRIIQGYLTPKGRTLMDGHARRLHRVMAQATEGFDSHDRQTVTTFFRRFIEAAKTNHS